MLWWKSFALLLCTEIVIHCHRWSSVNCFFLWPLTVSGKTSGKYDMWLYWNSSHAMNLRTKIQKDSPTKFFYSPFHNSPSVDLLRVRQGIFPHHSIHSCSTQQNIHISHHRKWWRYSKWFDQWMGCGWSKQTVEWWRCHQQIFSKSIYVTSWLYQR